MTLTDQGTFHTDHTTPPNGWVFVFGSNLAGRHGRGAARIAQFRFGAKRGFGVGRYGMSYAIPTKDANFHPLALWDIKLHIDAFLHYAREHKKDRFFVTRIGCGLAGYADAKIAPFFKNVSVNCSLPLPWMQYVCELPMVQE